MKKNNLFLSIIICIFVNVGCSKSPDTDTDEAYLNLSKLTIDLANHNASTQSVEVTSSTNWTAKVADASASWITINTSNGAKGETVVNVNISANPSKNERNGEIKFTLTGEDASFAKVLKISQPGVTDTPDVSHFSISLESKDVSSVAGSFEVNVKSSDEWTTKNVPSWITLSLAKGSGDNDLTVDYDENTTTEQRSASITFTSGDFEEELLITQTGKAQPTISLSITSKNVDADADKFDIQVTSNTDWKITEKPTWVSVSADTGNGNKTITVNYEANTATAARAGSIKFAIIGKSVTFEIAQQGDTKMISLDITSKDVPSLAGTFNVNLKSNTDWSIKDKPEWITLSSSSGNNDATINIDYKTNSGIEPRVATLTFMTAEGESIKLTITQAAAAPSFAISPDTELMFAKNANSKTITITSNVQWNVSSSDKWLTLSQASGKGNGSVVLSASVNNTQVARIATVVFVTDDNDNIRKTIQVTQGASQLPDFDTDEL